MKTPLMFSPFFQRPAYRHLTHELTNISEFRNRNQLLLRQGKYNLVTLWRHRKLQQHTGLLRDYVDYLSCRRAFGYSISLRQRMKLRSYTLFSTPFCWFQAMYGLRLFRYKQLSAQPDSKADWRHQQLNKMSKLTNQFIHQVQKAKSIIVVGNAAYSYHTDSAEFIDSHDLVFRFNHCFAQTHEPGVTGQKLSYWVIAPDCQTSLRLQPEHGCLLSGPEALGWIKTTQRVQQLVGSSDLLHIPLQIWRNLVHQLGAPPSSGLLILYWLFTLVEHEGVIHRIGFSTPEHCDQARYHHILQEHQGSTRHHWNMEWKLLEKWFQRQLKSE
jgi:hypothetical protein